MPQGLYRCKYPPASRATADAASRITPSDIFRDERPHGPDFTRRSLPISRAPPRPTPSSVQATGSSPPPPGSGPPPGPGPGSGPPPGPGPGSAALGGACEGDPTGEHYSEVMAVVTRGVAPTLDDARRAAQALVEAGVGEVWLYGSVARGESEPRSDIDLVAVLDDLEYRRRLRTKGELQEVAREACGRWVEVLCEAADMAVENAAKAVGVLSDAPDSWRTTRSAAPCCCGFGSVDLSPRVTAGAPRDPARGRGRWPSGPG